MTLPQPPLRRAAAGRAVLPAPPQAAGSYGSDLGSGPRELGVKERRPAPLSRVQDAVNDALLTGERLRLLALSALMVGGALWLRRWAAGRSRTGSKRDYPGARKR